MNNSFLFLMSILSDSSPNILQTASFIANSEFLFSKTTSVVWWQHLDQVDYLANFTGSVKTIDMSVSFNESIALEQGIIFVTSSEEFIKIVQNVDKKITYPSKVITILMNANEVDKITEIAWNFDITDLIILTQENQSISKYTYYPYSSNKCGNTSPVKVNFEEDFFPRKFKNLFGCEIRLGSITAPPYSKLKCVNGSSSFYKGLIGELVGTIVNHMNTTLKVVCTINTNKKMIEDLERKTYHILTAVIFNQDFLATLNTPVYHFFDIVWCGPPQREIYTYIKVLVPMMSLFTVFLFFTYFIHVVVLKIIDNIKRTRNYQVAWKAFATLMGQAIEIRSDYWLINSMYALWFWFCLLINIAYQGVLVKGLQTKYLEPRFDRIENARSLVDGYGGTIRSRELYVGTPIIDNYEVKSIPTLLTYLSPISRGKRFLIITTRLILLGYNSLQIFELVTQLPMTMSMTPRWGPGSEIILSQTRLIEGGFWQKNLKDAQLAIEKREAKLSVTSEFVAGHLSFTTLSTCFYGLGLMSLICILIFLFELLYFKLK